MCGGEGYFAARRFASMKRASIMALELAKKKQPALCWAEGGKEQLGQGSGGRRRGDSLGRLSSEEGSAGHCRNHSTGSGGTVQGGAARRSKEEQSCGCAGGGCCKGTRRWCGRLRRVLIVRNSSPRGAEKIIGRNRPIPSHLPPISTTKQVRTTNQSRLACLLRWLRGVPK
jgi:hypothetical protein